MMLSFLLSALLAASVTGQTKYPTTSNYCDMVCYGGLFGYTGECCMETYCYCQANGNFFLYCPAGQSWCPEQNTCIPDCHSDCQCLNPTTTTTKSPDTTSSPRQPTTTTRYPDTTTRYPDTTTRYPATTTYPWQTTTTGYPYTTTRYPATTTYPWQTTTTGYPYTTTKYPATTTYPWQTTTTGYPYSTTTTGYPYTTTRTTSTTTYPEGVCPEGWIESVEGCFLFQHTERISWREAQELCEYQGGYLAEIRTEDQQTFIESLAMLEEEFVGARPWFIGLTDFGHEGRWTWHHSVQEAEFTSWAPGYPKSDDSGDDCAVLSLSQGYQWTDVNCDQTEGSPICMRDLGTVSL